MKNKSSDIDYALAKLLLERVQNKRGTIAYGDCATELSAMLGRSINPHFNLSEPLYHTSEICFELGLPLLSALVIYKNDTTGTGTGQGFYKMASDYRPEYKSMEPKAAWKAELVRIRSCADWSPLSDYLKQHC